MRAQGPIAYERITGSARKRGKQFGTLYGEGIRQAYTDILRCPPKLSKSELQKYLDTAVRLLRRDFPDVLAELAATAEAAKVPLEGYVQTLYEELWDDAERSDRYPLAVSRGCTDIVARKTATMTGELLVGHNNDLSNKPADAVLVEYVPDDGVPFFAFSIDGTSISTAFNRAGLVFTGNEITADDRRPGIPRLLLMRIACTAESLPEALELINYPERASNYNNIVSDSDGNVRNVEASATEQVEIPLADDYLAHTNHHQVLKHRALEAPTASSDYRLRRATYLLAAEHGSHTVQTFKTILSDHRRGRDGICRHGESEIATKFSTVFQPERGVVHFCMGNPCVLPFQKFRYL